MKPIVTPRLLIRNWESRDREAFRRLNGDVDVMAFFPFRRTAEEADRFMEELRARNGARGYGFAAVELRANGECVGFAGLHDDNVVPSISGDYVEIGWRLLPQHWRKGYASEAALALLNTGFSDFGLEEIVSYAVWNNERSTSVMRRIGMRAEPQRDFDHPRIPDTHPHLRRHAFYRITRDEWRLRQQAEAG